MINRIYICMKPIGGYFELELLKASLYHQTLALKSGRAAFHWILKNNRKNVYIPFYTCNALLEPIKRIDIPFEFYGLNQALEPKFLPNLEKDEYLLYINYFDIKRDTVEKLSQKYGERSLWITHKLFF